MIIKRKDYRLALMTIDILGETCERIELQIQEQMSKLGAEYKPVANAQEWIDAAKEAARKRLGQ